MHPNRTRCRAATTSIVAALAALTLSVEPAAADKHDAWLARAHDVAMWRFPFVCQPIAYNDEINPVPSSDPASWNGMARLGGSPCTVYLNPHWRRWPYRFLCTLVVHEVGHLYGLRHSRNARSIMYPYAPQAGTWRPCRPGWHR